MQQGNLNRTTHANVANDVLLKLHFDPFLELGNKMENLRVSTQ